MKDKEQDKLNTWYYINAYSVEIVDGALICKINERKLKEIFDKYFK